MKIKLTSLQRLPEFYKTDWTSGETDLHTVKNTLESQNEEKVGISTHLHKRSPSKEKKAQFDKEYYTFNLKLACFICQL